MTPHHLLPLVLLAVAAGPSGDQASPSSTPPAQPGVAAPSHSDDPSPSGCSALSVTLYGHHENGTGWIGDAQVSIDGGAPEHATFLDQGTDAPASQAKGEDKLSELKAGKRFRGTELLTLTFDDGATLAEDASYVGVPASTPYLYELHETGTLSGTGRFEGASGHVTVAGPFLNPLYASTPLWIATMTGSLCE